MKKKCILIFPPLAHPAQPYLSVPLLAGQLKKVGFDVSSRDLNVEFFNDILDKKYLEFCYQNRKGNKKVDSFCNSFSANIKDAIENVGDSVNIYKSDKFYDSETLIKAIKRISVALKIVSLKYYPTEISFANYKNPNYSFEYDDVKEFCFNKEENIFLDYFTPFVEQINNENIDFVGISIPYTTQIVPALTLAYLIKQNTKAHVNIGGNLISRLSETFIANPEFFDIFADTVSIGDGEIQIVNLVKNLDDYSSVDGLIFKSEQGVFCNPSKPIDDLSVISVPNYEGYDFKKYFSPEIICTLQFSKGCYWGKCTFCDFYFGKPRFYHKSISQIVDEIQYVQEKYSINKFEFSDEAIPPKLLKEFAQELIRRNVKITYFVMSRTEKEFSKDILSLLYKSGLRMMNWGIESGSERILKLMNKGIDVNDRLRLLSDSDEIGIWNHSYVMLSFPTETKKELQETIDFYVNNENIIHSYNSQDFCANKHSKIIKCFKDYNVELSLNKNFLPYFKYSDTITDKLEDSNSCDEFRKKYVKACGLGLWQLIFPDEYLFLYVNKLGKDKLRQIKIEKRN